MHNIGDSACPLPCSDIDPGEHCDETTKKCVCGAPGSPSCIGNKDKPYCYHGKCEGNFTTITGDFYSNLIYFSLYFLCVSACAHPNVYCVGTTSPNRRYVFFTNTFVTMTGIVKTVQTKNRVHTTIQQAMWVALEIIFGNAKTKRNVSMPHLHAMEKKILMTEVMS